MDLNKSVGVNGVNLANDVKTIQTLLNNARTVFPLFGNSTKVLSVDGQCGNNTKTAIEQFQSKVMKFKYPDGKVEPGKNTWKKLNGNIASPLQIKTNPHATNNFLNWLSGQISSSFLTAYDSYLREMEDISTKNSSVNSKISPMRQGDSKWGQTKLGNSNSASIHGYGCAMVSLTMAATYIGSRTEHWPDNISPKNLTPLLVNNILKKAGVFSSNSYLLYIVGGAKALGMTAVDSGVGVQLNSSVRSKLDSALKNGLVLAHVDYKKDWKGDHWILLTDKNVGGSYLGIDPAYGKKITLYSTPSNPVETAAHALMYGRSTSMGSNTPQNVQSYKVVRYITLK